MTAAKPAVKPTPFKIEHICGRSACRAPNATHPKGRFSPLLFLYSSCAMYVMFWYAKHDTGT